MTQKVKSVLILGGTTEATALIKSLSNNRQVKIILSLAGATKTPILPEHIMVRIGGFGGIDGLSQWLIQHAIDILIDATHPFAAQITHNAWQAAQKTKTAFLRINRPAWQACEGDCWHPVANMVQAAQALGEKPLRVFLTIGRKDLFPFKECPIRHEYWIRSVDRPPEALLPVNAKTIQARGPFDEASEIQFLQAHHIERLVTKNSGGQATIAKLIAARKLGIPVIMVQRPETESMPMVQTWLEAFEWLFKH